MVKYVRLTVSLFDVNIYNELKIEHQNNAFMKTNKHTAMVRIRKYLRFKNSIILFKASINIFVLLD